MKYAIVLYDGMADYPVPALGGKTPMMVANKPNMDALAAKAEVGLVHTVPEGMKPGSDVCNLCVMGYDPKKYYTGRSPLEAVSIGVRMDSEDVALRCNLVTLSEDNVPYKEKTIVDYCAGDISTEEARQIIQTVQKELGSPVFEFYAGVSYRHCLLWHAGDTVLGNMTPPHDITGNIIGPYLSAHKNAVPLIKMMKKSFDILKDHPVNLARKAAGKNPANAIWLWGEGKKPALPDFEKLRGVSGGVVSAVDLIKGIGGCAGMEVAEVPGATGYLDTNFEGKAQAAVELLRRNDFVYLHLEAPDECGHRNEPENKVKAIELIDQRVLPILLKGLEQYGDYKLMILPDHPTPIVTRTHAKDPVPYLIYHKNNPKPGVASIDEESAKATGICNEYGPGLIEHLLND